MLLQCPHCKYYIVVVEINCGIFRHGVFKATGKQIDSHLPKDACDKLVSDGLIYGCGKPFQVHKETNQQTYCISVCDYI